MIIHPFEVVVNRVMGAEHCINELFVLHTDFFCLLVVRGAAGTVDDTYFGHGNGVYWMNDLECVGNETMLEDCQYTNNITQSHCYDDDDDIVGVICYDTPTPQGE